MCQSLADSHLTRIGVSMGDLLSCVVESLNCRSFVLRKTRCFTDHGHNQCVLYPPVTLRPDHFRHSGAVSRRDWRTFAGNASQRAGSRHVAVEEAVSATGASITGTTRRTPGARALLLLGCDGEQVEPDK